MPPTVVTVLVVTLLLPGLVMLFAVVVRYLLRGAPRVPGRDDDDGPPDPRP
jgi:hypothetical protein